METDENVDLLFAIYKLVVGGTLLAIWANLISRRTIVWSECSNIHGHLHWSDEELEIHVVNIGGPVLG